MTNQFINASPLDPGTVNVDSVVGNLCWFHISIAEDAAGRDAGLPESHVCELSFNSLCYRILYSCISDSIVLVLNHLHVIKLQC